MADWRSLAACQGMDPELFFPDNGKPPPEVLAACAVCPVSAECLSAAAESDDWLWGVRGGKSESERRSLDRRRYLPLKASA